MKYIMLLVISLLMISMSMNVYLYNEKIYYQSTTYDAQRFANKAPVIKSKLDELGATIGVDVIYISLFHNGLKWGNDEFHPPLVNEVFFWRRDSTESQNSREFEARLETFQNIPLDSVQKIYETLNGNCVGIRIDIVGKLGNEFDIDIRCPLTNQRNEVVGYFGALTRNATNEDITKYTSILSLYQNVFGPVLFEQK